MIPSKEKQEKKWRKKSQISWKERKRKKEACAGWPFAHDRTLEADILASVTDHEGCVGPRVVLEVWVVLGFTFWLDSDQNAGILRRSSLFIKIQWYSSDVLLLLCRESH